VGVDTLYPNMTDAYTDTPWRERGQWWGDAFVENEINQVAFGDVALLRRGLVFMADAQDGGQPDAMAPNGDGAHMLDFGFLWVQALHRYWQWTGDGSFLESLYPSLCDFMDYVQSYENVTTGLLDLPLDHWSQTALIDWAGYHSRYGQSTALNAFYYRTLLDSAEMADALGDATRAWAWRQAADEVRQQANESLYLAAEGRYRTTIYGGESIPPSPHAQAWALAYGLVPQQEMDAVASALLELLSADPAAPNVEIYGMYWVLRALGEAGRIPEALQIIESYYGRLLDLGATTWWEGFTSNDYYTGSLCHGWGGAPTWFLSTYVLGLRHSGPGEWQLNPSLEGLSSASGVLPFPAGQVRVQWQRPTCQEAVLTVTSPPGTTGEIVIPFTGAATALTLDGALIWENGSPLVAGVTALPDGIRVRLAGGGTHTFDVSQDCPSPDNRWTGP
jgi:alpha-L-rhamnosidase